MYGIQISEATNGQERQVRSAFCLLLPQTAVHFAQMSHYLNSFLHANSQNSQSDSDKKSGTRVILSRNLWTC